MNNLKKLCILKVLICVYYLICIILRYNLKHNIKSIFFTYFILPSPHVGSTLKFRIFYNLFWNTYCIYKICLNSIFLIKKILTQMIDNSNKNNKWKN